MVSHVDYRNLHDVKDKPTMVERAMLIGITLPGDAPHETEGLLDELAELVSTLVSPFVIVSRLPFASRRQSSLLDPGRQID